MFIRLTTTVERREEKRGAVVTSLSSGSSLQSAFSLPVPNLSQFPSQMSCTISSTGLQRETNDNSNKKALVPPQILP